MLAHEQANKMKRRSIQALHPGLGLERVMKCRAVERTRANFNEEIREEVRLLRAVSDGKMPS